MSLPPLPDRARVDARDKVLGRTRYAADVPIPGLLHAMTVPSTIARGRLLSLDIDAAMRVPGVLRVLTSADFANVPPLAPSISQGGYGFQSVQPMAGERIAYRGQAVALVVAQTLEAAIEAAHLVEPRYAAEPFAATLDQPGATPEPLASRGVSAGDAQAALAQAAHRVEVEYRLPAQHHNPIEMISTTASFEDGRLVIHEGSQNTAAIKFGLAAALQLDPERIHVASPYTGGGFGQKNSLQSQTVLVARAAILLGRPVKLVMPRAQLFHTASFRPESRHHVTLGAGADGTLRAARYEVASQASRADSYTGGHHEMPSRLYEMAYLGTESVIHVDTQSPGAMRAPTEHPASVAFECAVDEMAYRLGQDPLAFRLANQARHDPVSGQPFSSRFLEQCLREGAERFGWERRSAAPRSMRADDGTQIGWGVACGAYKAATTPTLAKLRISASGATRFAVAGHELGQGMRSAITAALVAELDCDPARVEVLIGDTEQARQHLTAGSWGTASVIPAVRHAVEQMRARVDALLAGRRVDGNLHRRIAAVRRPFLEVEVQGLGPGQTAAAYTRFLEGRVAATGPVYPGFTSFSWITHFVEVRVEPRTRRVRVPRVVSVADCGRVMSPRTAASQVRGGVVWAIGASLREIGEVDVRFGGALNNDLAEYLVPVNADIGSIEVSFIDQPDPLLNDAGVKGLGEVAMVGAAAAINNAVYHATGTRVRRMPIRVEDLL
jgi:xanthine dehydrogenase YagR molybdenum-binding subunit